jgi:hypothetical protein
MSMAVGRPFREPSSATAATIRCVVVTSPARRVDGRQGRLSAALSWRREREGVHTVRQTNNVILPHDL